MRFRTEEDNTKVTLIATDENDNELLKALYNQKIGMFFMPNKLIETPLHIIEGQLVIFEKVNRG